MNRAKVLIVDDSALMRELLADILGRAADLEVVGSARDPSQAGPMIARLRPQVVTLDVEMPNCDGITFLEQLMRTNPVPVIMVSSVTERGSELALRALELGAVDVVEKPKLDLKAGVLERADELVMKVRAAVSSRPRPRPRPISLPSVARQPTASRNPGTVPHVSPVSSARSPALIPVSQRPGGAVKRLIVIGASTGGTEALCELLRELPTDCPPVLIVQHMPGAFTGKFAERLNLLCRIRVREAKDGDTLEPGTALIGPGGLHLRVASGKSSLVVRLNGEPASLFHKPSVDVLFESVASLVGKRAIGVILTGMGADGARGLLEMRRAGSRTFAQDEASCVVFGMPKEAIARGAVERVLPLQSIARAVMNVASERSPG